MGNRNSFGLLMGIGMGIVLMGMRITYFIAEMLKHVFVIKSY